MTYEYKCESCKSEWVVDQKITDEPVTICKFCGKETAKRLISNGSFVLTGPGWAKDNYGIE